MSSKPMIPVANWALSATSQRPADEFLPIKGSEQSLGNDEGKLGNAANFQPGGKYHAIVKLQIKYDGQREDDSRYAQGTGWLVQPNLLVTDGHLTYDHESSLGKAVEVKAYVGYNGKNSIGKDDFQFRSGTKVATTKAWVESGLKQSGDVGFVALDRSFDKINPIQWEHLLRGQLFVENAGYPSDAQSSREEEGAGTSRNTGLDLRTTASNMSGYEISSYAAQSGSPVLVHEDHLDSIGVATYGLGDGNSASSLRGHLDDDFLACIGSFDSGKFIHEITYVDVPQNQTQIQTQNEITTDMKADEYWIVPAEGDNVDAESSFSLQSVIPFLGPIGAPIGGVVDNALSQSRRADRLTGPNTHMIGTELGDAPMRKSRAVLAERNL